jgi:hypothetical protein
MQRRLRNTRTKRTNSHQIKTNLDRCTDDDDGDESYRTLSTLNKFFERSTVRDGHSTTQPRAARVPFVRPIIVGDRRSSSCYVVVQSNIIRRFHNYNFLSCNLFDKQADHTSSGTKYAKALLAGDHAKSFTPGTCCVIKIEFNDEIILNATKKKKKNRLLSAIRGCAASSTVSRKLK